jgi:peptidylprolyl isomerase
MRTPLSPPLTLPARSGKDGDLTVPFWSTRDAGQTPFTFVIGQSKVIPAWDQGVATMKLGEIARITAAPDFAYGAGGFAAWGILPNSVLIFEIEALTYE